MKSTGEVLGIDTTFAGALLRALLGAGIAPPPPGGRILWSISDAEKRRSLPVARAFVELGFQLYATPGTWQLLHSHGVSATRVNKIAEGSPHCIDLIAANGVDLVINDAAQTSMAQSDGFRIRRAAVEAGIACLTSLDTVRALLVALGADRGERIEVRSLQDFVRTGLTVA